MVDRLAPGLQTLARSRQQMLSDEGVAVMKTQIQPYLDGGFSRALAARTVLLDHIFPALDVVETAARHDMDVERVAKVFFGLRESLALGWLRKQVESLEVLGRWHAKARADLRDELFSQQNRLVEQILQTAGEEKNPVTAWIRDNINNVQQIMDMLQDMKNNAEMDYATIAVAVQSLGELVEETA